MYLNKYTSFRYLIYFIVFLYVGDCIIFMHNPEKGLNTFIYLLQIVFLYILPTFLLSACFLSTENRLKKFIKFYFIALFSIFLFGLTEFLLGKLLNIEFINIIQKILANERYISTNNTFTLCRLSSVFAEPGWLCGFVFLNFPIIYNCCHSKFKIYNNKYWNKIIKKTLIPLAWSNIIFSMSPIWLILCTFQALYIFQKKILKYIFSETKFLAVLFFLVISLIISTAIILDHLTSIPQVNRIISTLTNISSFESLINAEPSLGTRLVCYYLQIKIFLSNFWIGIGLNNVQYYASDTIIQYKIPMTPENYAWFQISLQTGDMHVCSAVLYTLLTSTGIIGTFLYYTFIYKSFKAIKKYIIFVHKSLLQDFSKGVLMSLFFYVFMTLYDTVLANPYNWFFLGLSCSIAIFCRQEALFSLSTQLSYTKYAKYNVIKK